VDPISQAALGAVTGQAVGHARLGMRAAVAGAAAGALPDIDVLFSIGGDYFDQLVVHRGITHSLFFAPVAGPALGALIWWWERCRLLTPEPGAPDLGRLGTWMLVVSLALLSHPLLDLMTPYGTQLLLPFSDTRFAINAMPIIDPAYTLILLFGLWGAARWWRPRAQTVALITLAASCGYLGWGGYLNAAAEREATRQLAAAGITDARVRAFPTILQVHYRRVVARRPDEDLVGFVSLWRPCDIDWTRATRAVPPSTRETFLATREGAIFDWFAMGWARYRIDDQGWPRRLVVTDLRYGFDANPDRSIFVAHAPLNQRDGLAGPVRATQDSSDANIERLAQVFQEAYPAACAVVGL
jgi:inner membrane protein